MEDEAGERNRLKGTVQKVSCLGRIDGGICALYNKLPSRAKDEIQDF